MILHPVLYVQVQGQEKVQVQVQVQYLLVLFLNILDLPFVLLQLVPRLLQVPPQLGLESHGTVLYSTVDLMGFIIDSLYY